MGVSGTRNRTPLDWMGLAKAKAAFPQRTGGRHQYSRMEEPIVPNRKEQEMISVEIENCRQNIEFYKEQIDQMEKKLDELEQLKKSYEYY